MLLEMAIADAYGIGFEFVHKLDWKSPNDLSGYHQHPEYVGLIPGQYTDDTQRAVANVRVMLAGDQYNAKAYASEYIRILKDDPRDGYSRRYQEFLETRRDADHFLKTVSRRRSNGALMGVAPLGFLHSPEEVILAASIQALTTHSAATVPYACAIALAANYFIYDRGVKQEMEHFIYTQLQMQGMEFDPSFFDHSAKKEQTSMDAEMTYVAVIRALLHNDSLAGVMHWAVDCGGDTDSAAAISVAIASCSKEFKKDIPQVLYDKLENRTFGREYLRYKDGQLMLQALHAHTDSLGI